MATSGSKNISVTSYDTLQFNWSQSSQSTANNTTTVAWTLKLVAGSSGKIISTASKSWAVTVNGTKYSGTNSVAVSNNATITLASGTTTITHESDGSKVFSYSFSQQFDITFSGSWIGTRSGSGTGTLDTIARKSTLSVADGTLGTAQTLTISEKVSSFEHKLTYSCGTASGYILGNENGCSTSNSTSWTPPLELAEQNKTGKTVSVKFTLTTYKSGGTTVVGSNTYTKTFTIPNKLSCSLDISDATGKASTYGGYIKGISQFKIKVTPDISNSYSPVASYSVTANGTTYASADFTTDILKQSDTLTISAKVTDQRGDSYTKTQTVTVQDYTAPTVSKLTVNRCNSDGTVNDQGGYIKVTYSGAITSLSNKNTAQYQLQYKKTTSTSYTTINLSTAYTVADGTKVFSAETGSSYDVRIVATDKFSSYTRSTTASSAFTIMHFNASGNGMGLGKVSEFAGLDVGFQIRPYGGYLQPVLEDGVDLDTLTKPNTYTLKNAVSANYGNRPSTLTASSSTAVLKIESCGENGQLRQTITLCNSTAPCVYERFYYINTSGAMVWYPWKRTTEVVLFDKTTSNTGNITLSETAANFKYLEIFFTDNNGLTGGYSKVYSPQGKTVCLSIIEPAASTRTYIRRSWYSISGQTMSLHTASAGYVDIYTDTTTRIPTHSTGTNYLKIVRVVGYE